MDATKAGFTSGMLAQDLASLSVGAPAAGVVSTNLSQFAGGLPNPEWAPGYLANAYWEGYAANFEAAAGVNYTTANGLSHDFSPFGDQPYNSTNMSFAFYDAMGPGGENIALISALGVTMISGHCSANPTDATNATGRQRRYEQPASASLLALRAHATIAAASKSTTVDAVSFLSSR